MGEIACNQTTLDNILIIAHQGSGHKTHFNNNCINIKDKYTTKLSIFYRNRNISLYGAFYHSTLTFHENKFQKSVKAFSTSLLLQIRQFYVLITCNFPSCSPLVRAHLWVFYPIFTKTASMISFKASIIL